VPDPVASSADSELRAHVERVLSAHYELDTEIGRGGMGIVYRARDRRLKRHVAIKVLPPELAFRSEIRSRFLREAETAASLNHPNIVDIYTVDELEGLVFFVMAYISGDNLAKRLHERGVLDVEETRRILREVADALAYAHERGVVHRDIKPDNIILDAESGRSMVTDFGIARAVTEGGDSRLTATGMALGTPAYMSPEQAAGERQIDGRSDLYSLGVVAYQMLCGEPPFTAASTPAMLVKHISERPTPVEQRRQEVPQDLARAVMMLLEKDPSHRFPSASALVAALDTGYVPTVQGRGLRVEGGNATARTQPSDVTHPPSADTRPTAAQIDTYATPAADDLRRWEAPLVQQFRRKLAPYLFVNAVILIASIFGDSDFFGITVLWSIYIAYKYAKLWTEGYDWRDVFRQPRDRELIDVADDVVEHSRALFDRNKRQELREQRRSRQLARRSLSGPGVGSGATVPPTRASDGAGARRRPLATQYDQRVREAFRERDEIIKMLRELPRSERERIPDVERSAIALADRVQSLAASLAEIERDTAAGDAEAVEAEIERLESAANPLDYQGSEERVRRLAYLKRQRRALADLASRRESGREKLETCADALRNMRLELVRLRAGSATHQNVTSLAMDAVHLADSVDGALYVAEELGRTRAPIAGTGGGRRGAGGAGARSSLGQG
jgi:tRNA A-37 threonylcarbamoyl transferase component Bud32